MNVFAFGASVGFFQGDTLKLIDDLQALRPTIFPSVPRVLNKIYDKITNGIAAAGGNKQALFERALKAKRENLETSGALTHWLWDPLLFGKLKKGLGLDRVRFCVTGSAPIAPEVHTFFRVLLGCNLYEGYGQTEGCAAATITSEGDFSTGHVGPPVPGVEMRLENVAEMGYYHTDKWHGPPPGPGGGGGIPCLGRGEICYRGPCVFKGYYKLADKTSETIDEDGWLHSGDIGIWTMSGNLKIVDRKKNIFKLAQGEYVAAEKIENVLVGSPLLAQAFVYGDSLQSHLVAVLVPDAEAAALKFPDTPIEALCSEPASPLRALITDEVARLSLEAKLAGFEVVRLFHLEPRPFDAESGLLTPTFKLKRHEAKLKYQAEIDLLYSQGATQAQPRPKL